jgi:hypothetical protein
LYFPQAHSKSFTGPKNFHRKTITLRLVRTVDRLFKTSPLDSFKIDSEASPIDILLNLLQDSFFIIISIIHHSFTIDLIVLKN